MEFAYKFVEGRFLAVIPINFNEQKKKKRKLNLPVILSLKVSERVLLRLEHSHVDNDLFTLFIINVILFPTLDR